MLVDDQPLFLSGMRALLRLAQVQVVGEAPSGDQAVATVKIIRPNVILMDLQMPGMSGVQAISELVRVWNQAAIVALTTFSDDKVVSQALRAGAIGYVLKDAHEDEVLAAIAAALRGEAFLPGPIATKVLSELRRTNAPHDLTPQVTLLSPRELEILRLLAAGASNKEIAGTLFIADGTVRNHVSAILAKLEVRDRTQAALKATRLGLL